MMADAFSSKTAKILIGVFVFAIIISFALSTGLSSKLSPTQDVASVNGESIAARDYFRAVESQQNFYQQIYQGQPLDKNMQEMIRKNVLEQLINSKLQVQLGQNLKLTPSIKEITDTIKKQEVFFTNKQFDPTKYKQLLLANGWSPQKYETQIANDLVLQNIQEITNSVFTSNKYNQELEHLKNSGLITSVIKLEKNQFVKTIPVTEEEIQAYLDDASNQEKIQKAYLDRNAEFNTPEKVKASHILLKAQEGEDDNTLLKRAQNLKAKLTKTNFADLANKNTEDPSGKGKGGSLGEFEKGRMVPPFEKAAFSLAVGEISEPVKTRFGYHIILVEEKIEATTTPVENVQGKLAKSLIQKTKTKELDEIFKTKIQEYTELVKTKSSSLDKLKDDIGFTYLKDQKLNILDSKISNLSIPEDDAVKLFDQTKVGDVIQTTEGDTAYIISLNKKEETKPTNKKEEALNPAFARSVSNNLVKNLRETAEVFINKNFQ